MNIGRLSRAEPTARIVFSFCIVAPVGTALSLLWRWQLPSSNVGVKRRR